MKTNPYLTFSSSKKSSPRYGDVLGSSDGKKDSPMIILAKSSRCDKSVTPLNLMTDQLPRRARDASQGLDSEIKVIKLLAPPDGQRTSKHSNSKPSRQESAGLVDGITSKRPSVQHSHSYILAMKALQDKIREMEQQLSSSKSEQVAVFMSRQQAQQILAVLDNLENSKRSLNDYRSKERSQQEIIAGLQDKNRSLMELNAKLTEENQGNELRIRSLQSQFESQRSSRQQEIDEYQRLVEQLTQKYAKEQTVSQEQSTLNQKLQNQIDQQKQYENEIKAILQNQQNEEVSKYTQQVSEQRQRITLLDQQCKRLDKQLKEVVHQKSMIERDFDNYKEQIPLFIVMAEQSRVIAQLEQDLIERDRTHTAQIDDLIALKRQSESDLNKKIQQLMITNSEHQAQLYQMTIEFQQLNMKYTALKLKLQEQPNTLRGSRSRERKSAFAQVSQRATVGVPSSDSFSAPNSNRVSPKFQLRSIPEPPQRIDVPDLKQVIRQCFADLSTTKPPETIKPPETPQPPKKKTLPSPRKTDLDNRIRALEMAQKEANDNYEILLRRAQMEEDYKVKATIRHQLIDLTDEIKRVNNEILHLQQEKRKKTNESD